ncbi:ankyrin repeat domain-containing protein [Mesorhizobium tamadayense]|uniref:Ankyrin repeat domain-containing protein n=1 Tax=Mesorhizobium tamadayense TaxID=425306 RepID=A0A3P3FQU6_9HYPH|nr:ankyrin repeat domain-containing protein [Mesorhizobium tamadayense]RRI00914.1 ankyrin repeat domain-containing protein [Mesorhizobium tamadayense]
MLEIPDDRCQRAKLFKAIDDAFKAGDFEGLGRALGDSARWFDERMPFELGLGHPLEYAIYWSPAAFIAALLEAGSNPNYQDHAGFPSIIAALSTERPDRLEIVRILIEHGADPNMRGVNDWTPLHYAVSRRDTEAIRLLLASGADPSLRTRIDDYETALEGAVEAGFDAGASLLRKAMSRRG